MNKLVYKNGLAASGYDGAIDQNSYAVTYMKLIKPGV
jgi:hypothetical protein